MINYRCNSPEVANVLCSLTHIVVLVPVYLDGSALQHPVDLCLHHSINCYRYTLICFRCNVQFNTIVPNDKRTNMLFKYRWYPNSSSVIIDPAISLLSDAVLVSTLEYEYSVHIVAVKAAYPNKHRLMVVWCIVWCPQRQRLAASGTLSGVAREVRLHLL